MRNPILPAVALSVLFVVGCSSSKSTTPSVGQATQDNTILGLWNSGFDDEVNEFFEIMDKSIVFYEYQGNESEVNKNCYIIESKVLVKVDTTSYSLDNSTDVIDIQATEAKLSISYVDKNDFDDDGDTSEILVDTYNRVENISSLDLNPCT